MSLSTTIVLSTYNGEGYIYEQLESIRNQTIVPTEVIICDDCSSDDTFKIVEDYINRYNLHNWHLRKNIKNKGWKLNFVELISEANGDLVFPCDQDDYWYGTKIEKMTKVMETNSQINVLVSYLDELYEDGRLACYPGKGDEKVSKIVATKNFMNVRYPGCVYCIRKSFVENCIKYWKPSIPHDGFFWRLGMFDDSLYEIRMPLIRQRKHADSTYAREARLSHNTRSKLEEIKYTSDMINCIKLHMKNSKSEKYFSILNTANRWNEKRLAFFTYRRIVDGVGLIKYIQYYQTIKRYFLDLYIVFLKK